MVKPLYLKSKFVAVKSKPDKLQSYFIFFLGKHIKGDMYHHVYGSRDTTQQIIKHRYYTYTSNTYIHGVKELRRGEYPRS